MADILERGLDWLVGQLKAHASREVVYRRGQSQVTVTAVIGRTLMRYTDVYGAVRVEWTDRDFIVPTEQLVLEGEAVLPKRGDRIEETVDGQTYVYQVLAPANEPEWRYADPYRKALRIHTKQVNVE